MQPNHTKFIVYRVIALIVLVIILGGVYFVTSKKAVAPVTEQEQLTQLMTSTTSAEVADSGLQTYTNSQYGFSFQYPTTLGNPNISAENAVVLLKDGNDSLDIDTPKVFLDDNGQPKTFVEFMSTYNTKGYIVTSMNVGGVASFGVSSSQIGDMVYVPFPNNQILVIITDFKNPIFNQILSTFKFTNTTSSAQVTSTQPSVTILSPKNGDVMKIGSTYTINWNLSGNIQPQDQLVVTLDQGGNIKTQTPASGSYSWAVPATMTIGDSYDSPVVVGPHTIQVRIYDGSPCDTCGTSPGKIIAEASTNVTITNQNQ